MDFHRSPGCQSTFLDRFWRLLLETELCDFPSRFPKCGCGFLCQPGALHHDEAP